MFTGNSQQVELHLRAHSLGEALRLMKDNVYPDASEIIATAQVFYDYLTKGAAPAAE